MSFNIDTFKSRGLWDNGARPSLFEVICNFPLAVNQNGVDDGGRFLIQAAQLPASLIDEVRVPYFGRFIKVFGNRTFQDWSITVMNDNNFGLRHAFEEWHNLINTMESNRLAPGVAGPINSDSTYKVDLRVQQYRPDGPASESGVNRHYRLIGAFPTAVNAINLAWDDVNRIETFDVTFSYDYWVLDTHSTDGFEPVIP